VLTYLCLKQFAVSVCLQLTMFPVKLHVGCGHAMHAIFCKDFAVIMPFNY